MSDRTDMFDRITDNYGMLYAKIYGVMHNEDDWELHYVYDRASSDDSFVKLDDFIWTIYFNLQVDYDPSVSNSSPEDEVTRAG